jgi:hypothetical protein
MKDKWNSQIGAFGSKMGRQVAQLAPGFLTRDRREGTRSFFGGRKRGVKRQFSPRRLALEGEGHARSSDSGWIVHRFGWLLPSVLAR